MNRSGDQLFTRTCLTQNQYGAVALRHHFDLFEYAVHGFAATDNFAELTVHIVQLLGQRQVFIDQTFFQAVYLLLGKRVIYRNGYAFGNLAQQFQVGGGENFFFTLRQFEHAKHRVAGHQRQQAQSL